MKQTVFRWIGVLSVVVTAAIASACASDASIAPDGATASPKRMLSVANVSNGNRLPDLTGCEKLAAPAGSTLVFSALGVGVQIYRWSGTSWVFVSPLATLYADAGRHGQVASHFVGLTWQSNSGGTVVGTVAQRCTHDAASIQWLSLSAVANGPGIFAKVTFIQRLNTVGGNAPSTPGSVVGEEVQVPYTADYLFYKTP